MDESRRQFIRLMTRHERLVYGYILSLVPNWADADEILQETNIRLWEEFEKFEAGTNFAAWAVRVAHFQVLTTRWLRSRAGRTRCSRPAIRRWLNACRSYRIVVAICCGTVTWKEAGRRTWLWN